MKIKYVTLTGADDSIDPADLIPLTEQYPFVEWAILFSQSKSGVERYPSLDWVDELVDQVVPNRKINLSAHLCGKWCEDALKGEFTFLREERYAKAFNRIQLNMGKDRLQLAVKSKPLIDAAMSRVPQPVIFGGNYKYIAVTGGFFEHTGFLPLFDASGGRGVETKEWPKPFLDSDGAPIYCGYAGGLGPDNIAEEVQRIADAAGDMTIWIDMETKLRTGDKFDLEKCERVLQVTRPWVG